MKDISTDAEAKEFHPALKLFGVAFGFVAGLSVILSLPASIIYEAVSFLRTGEWEWHSLQEVGWVDHKVDLESEWRGWERVKSFAFYDLWFGIWVQGAALIAYMIAAED